MAQKAYSRLNMSLIYFILFHLPFKETATSRIALVEKNKIGICKNLHINFFPFKSRFKEKCLFCVGPVKVL